MSQKLSKKERGETVTKGYFHDLLDEKDYVTNKKFDQFARNIGVMFEAQNKKFEILTELMIGRFDNLDSKIDGLAVRVGSLENRVGSLELRVGALEAKVG
jgi:hypothetical protein